jgi:hypothetical protein
MASLRSHGSSSPPLVDLCKLNAKATFGFGFGNGGGTILIHIAAVQPYMQKLL